MSVSRTLAIVGAIGWWIAFTAVMLLPKDFAQDVSLSETVLLVLLFLTGFITVYVIKGSSDIRPLLFEALLVLYVYNTLLGLEKQIARGDNLINITVGLLATVSWALLISSSLVWTGVLGVFKSPKAEKSTQQLNT